MLKVVVLTAGLVLGALDTGGSANATPLLGAASSKFDHANAAQNVWWRRECGPYGRCYRVWVGPRFGRYYR